MQFKSQTVRHSHMRRTPAGYVPVVEHYMRFWQSLSPEQKKEGRHSFLRVAFNRWRRTGDPKLAKNLLAQMAAMQSDRIAGGLGDGRPDSDFDPQALKKGIAVEMEHTNDPQVAKEISKDHLSEDKFYYNRLELIESGGAIRKLKDSDKDGVPDQFDCAPLDPKRQGMSLVELMRHRRRRKDY